MADRSDRASRHDGKFGMIFFFHVKENTPHRKIDRVGKELGLSRLWGMDAMGLWRDTSQSHAYVCACVYV